MEPVRPRRGSALPGPRDGELPRPAVAPTVHGHDARQEASAHNERVFLSDSPWLLGMHPAFASLADHVFHAEAHDALRLGEQP